MALKDSRQKFVSAAEDVREAARPAAEVAIDRLSAATEALSSATLEVLTTVATAVAPALEDAKERLAPVIDDARERLDDAREKVAPVAASAVVAGKAKGQQAAVKLGIVEEPKDKSHKLRNLVIALALGVMAALAYKKFAASDADPAWTATRDTAAASGTTSPDSVFSTQPEPTDQSDTAPTAPFASEETVESPVPTTPDQPLERRDV